MTQSTIDFNGLIEVLRAAKAHPHLKMDQWVCGTSACMIGSFCQANPLDPLYLAFGYLHLKTETLPVRNPDLAVALRFGITVKEAQWLFTCSPLSDCPYHSLHYRTKDPIDSNPDEAIDRLEKFIHYKLHKEGTKQVAGRNKMIIDYGKYISGRKSAVYASAV